MPAVALKPPFALVLREDNEAESPRVSSDCFGRMVCFHDRYKLGDKHDYDTPEDFLRDLAEDNLPHSKVIDYVLAGKAEALELRPNEDGETWDVRSDWDFNGNWLTVETFPAIRGHEEDVAASLIYGMETGDLYHLLKDEICILPLYLYDHSGITMNTEGFSDKWDSGTVGWIYADKEAALAEYGGDTLTPEIWEKAENLLRGEVAEYDSYLRGECYGFELYKAGEMSNSCWGFIGDLSELQPDIESHLPEGCKGIMDNIVYLNSDRELDGVLMENAAATIYMEGDSFMSNQGENAGAVGVKMDARAYPFEEPKGKQLAFASVTINGCFAITGIKVMDGGEKGPFVAMPSAKDREGNYKDICFPTSKEVRAELNAVVMDAYNAAIEKGLSDRAADRGAPEQEKPSAVGKLNEAKKESQSRAKTPKPDKSAPKKSEPAL